MSAIARTPKHRDVRSTNQPESFPPANVPIRIASASVALSVLTVQFDQEISLSGTPAYTTDVAGASPVSAVRTADDTIQITFDNAVATATVVNISYNDPAVRNSSGGFVADSTFTI